MSAALPMMRKDGFSRAASDSRRIATEWQLTAGPSLRRSSQPGIRPLQPLRLSVHSVGYVSINGRYKIIAPNGRIVASRQAEPDPEGSDGFRNSADV